LHNLSKLVDWLSVLLLPSLPQIPSSPTRQSTNLPRVTAPLPQITERLECSGGQHGSPKPIEQPRDGNCQEYRNEQNVQHKVAADRPSHLEEASGHTRDPLPVQSQVQSNADEQTNTGPGMDVNPTTGTVTRYLTTHNLVNLDPFCSPTANFLASSRSFSSGCPLFFPPTNLSGPLVSKPRQENSPIISKPFSSNLSLSS